MRMSGPSRAKTGWRLSPKDNDFNQMSFLYGAPPKVVWLRAGNCSTDRVIALIRARTTDVLSFIMDQSESLLILD